MQNKKFFFIGQLSVIVFLLILFQSAWGQEKFKYKVIGTVADSAWNGNWVYLSKIQIDSIGMIKVDSVKMSRRKFKFQGKLDELPHLYNVYIMGKTGVYLTLERGNIRIKIEKDSVQLSGTPINDSLFKYIIQPFQKISAFQRVNELRKETLKKDRETSKSEVVYWKNFSQLNKEWKVKKWHFVKTYAEYPVIEMFLIDILRYPEAEPELALVQGRLSEESRQRVNWRMEKYRRALEQAKKENAIRRKMQDEKQTPETVRVGCKYIDFQGLDLNGDTLKLSEMVSGKKLVLLDFWASWCAPCMKEMPVIDSLYRKYRSKGLEVIGISSDQDPAAWKKTVSQRHMDWRQMREVKNIGDLYGIYFIPYTILLDSEGRILARNLKGEKLCKEVEKYLGD